MPMESLEEAADREAAEANAAAGDSATAQQQTDPAAPEAEKPTDPVTEDEGDAKSQEKPLDVDALRAELSASLDQHLKDVRDDVAKFLGEQVEPLEQRLSELKDEHDKLMAKVDGLDLEAISTAVAEAKELLALLPPDLVSKIHDRILRIENAIKHWV